MQRIKIEVVSSLDIPQVKTKIYIQNRKSDIELKTKLIFAKSVYPPILIRVYEECDLNDFLR